ncbi:uncharacterized protein I303_102855 [Kwoniella dejecticola CBS 10117]|uniref:Uncharacterized protein n=1 Tax=Kwoniella dejecticola CBS 10117 TaxID=1296121 RepID=A0A1A6A9W5_9TREE|nr:uncharacterized protein I303_02871 [Kwoniella dejecticola CBS 10117]OBR86852.1 hypothetical protein I303_02871 [Kwoniella dejecticola CBS 10117]
MKASAESNEIEVWVECDDRRLKEYSQAFDAHTIRLPPTHRGYLEIGTTVGRRYTVHVKASALIESSTLDGSTISYSGDLLSRASIDGTEICTAFLFSEQGYQASHSQYGESTPTLEPLDTIGNVHDGEFEIHSHLVDESLEEVDTNKIVLLNDPSSALGKIVISIFRGTLSPEYRRKLIATKGSSSDTPHSNTDKALSIYNDLDGTDLLNTPSNPWTNDERNDIDPWIRFEYHYGTREALSFNGVDVEEGTSNKTLDDENKKLQLILVPDSCPPSPKLDEDPSSPQSPPTVVVDLMTMTTESQLMLRTLQSLQTPKVDVNATKQDRSDPPATAKAITDTVISATGQDDRDAIPRLESADDLSALLPDLEAVDTATDVETQALLQALMDLADPPIGSELLTKGDPDLNYTDRVAKQYEVAIPEELISATTIPRRLPPVLSIDYAFSQPPRMLATMPAGLNRPSSNDLSEDPFSRHQKRTQRRERSDDIAFPTKKSLEMIHEAQSRRTFTPHRDQTGHQSGSSSSITAKRKDYEDRYSVTESLKRHRLDRPTALRTEVDGRRHNLFERDVKRREEERRKWLTVDESETRWKHVEDPSASQEVKKNSSKIQSQSVVSKEDEAQRIVRRMTRLERPKGSAGDRDTTAGASKESAIDLTLLSDSD